MKAIHAPPSISAHLLHLRERQGRRGKHEHKKLEDLTRGRRAALHLDSQDSERIACGRTLRIGGFVAARHRELSARGAAQAWLRSVSRRIRGQAAFPDLGSAQALHAGPARRTACGSDLHGARRTARALAVCVDVAVVACAVHSRGAPALAVGVGPAIGAHRRPRGRPHILRANLVVLLAQAKTTRGAGRAYPLFPPHGSLPASDAQRELVLYVSRGALAVVDRRGTGQGGRIRRAGPAGAIRRIRIFGAQVHDPALAAVPIRTSPALAAHKEMPILAAASTVRARFADAVVNGGASRRAAEIWRTAHTAAINGIGPCGARPGGSIACVAWRTVRAHAIGRGVTTANKNCALITRARTQRALDAGPGPRGTRLAWVPFVVEAFESGFARPASGRRRRRTVSQHVFAHWACAQKRKSSGCDVHHIDTGKMRALSTRCEMYTIKAHISVVRNAIDLTGHI